MKKMETMKTINQIALVACKVLEILHWTASAFMLVLLVCSLAAKEWLGALLNEGAAQFGGSLSTYGFEIEAIGAGGAVNMAAFTLFAIAAVAILNAMAMVFRNAYLIMKTAKGKTWFAKGSTPFQHDIVRMVREIGIFYIAVPLIGLAMSAVFHLLPATQLVETSVRMEGLVTGVLILCLSQAFQYGMRLESDVEGLV